MDEAERRVYSVRIGAIASDLARVSRSNILENAVHPPATRISLSLLGATVF